MHQFSPLKLLKQPKWLSYSLVKTNKMQVWKEENLFIRLFFTLRKMFFFIHRLKNSINKESLCMSWYTSVCLESELKHSFNSPVDEKLSMLVAAHNDDCLDTRHSHSHLLNGDMYNSTNSSVWRTRNCFPCSIHLLSSSEFPLKARPESC